MPYRVRYLGSPIRSLESLASTLGCDVPLLKRIEGNIQDYYSNFDLPKKNGAGVRTISSPNRVLKTLQRRINSRIFCHCSFPAYLQGSIKDDDNPRDFVSNARIHSLAHTVISADIQDFFPSVEARLVKKVFKYLFSFSDDVSSMLTALTTVDGRLPQGAPTSSYLANLIFYDTEHKLVAQYSRSNLVYTRLIDDITISSSVAIDKKKKDWAINKVQDLLRGKGFKLHRGKLKIAVTNQPGQKVVVTGLWIDKGTPRLTAEDRNLIRAMVNHRKNDYDAGKKIDHDFHSDFNTTSGKVALMTRLGHPQGGTLRKTLNKCLPEYSKAKAKGIARMCRKFSARIGKGSDSPAYTRQFHKLMYSLAILGRTDRRQARSLRGLLQKYPPRYRVMDLEDQ